MESKSPINLSNNVQLFIQDANHFKTTSKYMMIYFDPPFNSKRNYKLNVDSSVGFTDKWNDDEYYNFIKVMIDKLYDLLEKNGTLFFHISSSCMFISFASHYTVFAYKQFIRPEPILELNMNWKLLACITKENV